MSQLEIRPVTDSNELKAFIEVPWAIYRHDPHWVPPLKFERKEALSSKNPYFEHAHWQAWLAYRDGVPVGRISAQVDSLYLEFHDPHTGFFGLIEAVDDAEVFAALFDAAEAWLEKQGMKTVLGPFNLGINQEIACLVEGFDTPPFVMMGHSRPYYGQQIEQQGYGKAEDVFSYGLDVDAFVLPKTMQSLLDRLSKKINVRPLNRKNTDADLKTMRDIFNDAWAGNWGFVPFTKKEFSAVGKELLMIVPSDFIYIAEFEGKPAAFIVLIPNLNEAIADLDGKLFPFGWVKLLWRLKVRFPKTARIALMGVRQEFQHTRKGPALAYSIIQCLHAPGVKRGVKRIEASWILEQNQGMRKIMEQLGGEITKRYRMYQKTLILK
jgi:hypothetical protein